MMTAMSLQAAPLPPAEELARNEVLAMYVGTKDTPCMHRTALCPDKCGHAKKVAIFKVLRNDGYEKKGEYGDAKAEPDTQIYVDVNKDVEGQDPEILTMLKGLKPADQVQLTQVHYYVTKEGSSYPVRPIVKMQPRLTCGMPDPAKK